MAHFEKQLSSEEIFAGRVIRVTVDKVELENGRTSTREVVHHHGGAGVIALNDRDEITLVRQFRYALGKELIEIPAGKLEPGEDPFDSAPVSYTHLDVYKRQVSARDRVRCPVHGRRARHQRAALPGGVGGRVPPVRGVAREAQPRRQQRLPLHRHARACLLYTSRCV